MTFGIFDIERRAMSIYGYCRISTAKQSIDRQVRNIRAEYPTAHIVQEAYTGTSILRPEWSKLYRILKEGDTVVFDSVSRMSRNAEEGFSLYEDLYHKGIRLIFLKEHHIDTKTYKKALSGSIAMTGTNVDFILKGINEYLMALAKEQIQCLFYVQPVFHSALLLQDPHEYAGVNRPKRKSASIVRLLVVHWTMWSA